jgi:hypothetical protein
MSQMTSTARGTARPLNRAPTETPRLRVVTGAPQRRAALFGIICVGLLAAGLIGLLVLNTALAQGSFTLHDLRATSDQLSDAESTLSESLNVSRSPANLAKTAAGLGMVPVQSAAFLRLSDGKVIGVAKPASPVPGFAVVGPPEPSPVATVPAGAMPVSDTTPPADAIPAPATTQPAAATPTPAATGSATR